MDKISDLKEIVINTLDLNKAQDIVTIDLKDKSSMADYMIIASGTSSRHIQSLSEQVLEKLKIKLPKTPKHGILFFKLSEARCLAKPVSTMVYKIIELDFSLHSLSILAICCSVLVKTNSFFS